MPPPKLQQPKAQDGHEYYMSQYWREDEPLVSGPSEYRDSAGNHNVNQNATPVEPHSGPLVDLDDMPKSTSTRNITSRNSRGRGAPARLPVPLSAAAIQRQQSVGRQAPPTRNHSGLATGEHPPRSNHDESFSQSRGVFRTGNKDANGGRDPVKANAHHAASFRAVRGPPRGLVGQRNPRLGYQRSSDQRIRRGDVSGQSSSGEENQRRKVLWAPRQELVTTRAAISRDIKAKDKERNLAYEKPIEQTDQVAVKGFYLWPDMKLPPSHYLGARLEDLDHIRHEMKVWIEWEPRRRTIVVSALLRKAGERADRAMTEQTVINTINAIRQEFQDAKARQIAVTPMYLLVPPSVTVMRKSVVPIRYQDGLTMFEFDGERLPNEELEDYKLHRNALANGNIEKISKHIMKHLLALAPIKTWLRMRVYFGHLNLGEYPSSFRRGECGLSQFQGLLDNPRTQASALFDKKIPKAMTALSLMVAVANKPDVFSSTNGVGCKIDETRTESTLCLFFRSTQGVSIRLEAEIERNEWYYQMGTVKIFRDNQRNKCLEIYAINIESKVDWSIEVITDKTIPDPDPEWFKLVDGAIKPEAKDRIDSLGLCYPTVTLSMKTGLPNVDSVVLRTKKQYKLKGSGYILEVTIYRQWNCRDTAKEPDVQASVSMYHPEWDIEMANIEGTTYVREWNKDLTQFFNNGEDETHGVRGFLKEVGIIATCVGEASEEFFNTLVRPEPLVVTLAGAT
ncbi:hypothetical protein BJ875DRAFT_479369 [Amylocarpus encephaloides]|uniref:DUF7905 domain-containing protein n=1 Tax=Amylocarpus encephaloides TaxID=45428 RepID=A0A9P7YTI8_9HELO|nr:hypothetical protein BJ875DRAFT_479369 [Amylocarpus encephaloides]